MRKTNPVDSHVVDKKDHIVWSIHNQGKLISPTNLQMLFDPVRRYAVETTVPRHSNPQRHLGLGLCITREIIKAHSGTIRATSSAAKSTTFAIWLPLSRTR